MRDYSTQNKKAWEYNAYDFWVKNAGTPEEMAKKNLENPKKMLRKYAQYFDKFEGIKVANICGSCGKKAIPLALLGADVTIFDISEHNKRYAMEVAVAANTTINYEVGDVLDIDLNQYGGYFDVVFMEGGILHYFIDSLGFQQPTMSYFSTEVFEGEMAHARFFDEETRKNMPKCSYRKYTISEIINSIIGNGFTLQRFDEHPSWENAELPGEFTAIGIKP